MVTSLPVFPDSMSATAVPNGLYAFLWCHDGRLAALDYAQGKIAKLLSQRAEYSCSADEVRS